MTRSAGRIVFADNPWPRGHRIERAVWSGRIDDRGLWFDLHVESARYDEDDDVRAAAGDGSDEDVVDPPGGDWAAKAVWGNYHRCSLSSTKWRCDGGFLVGTAEQRFDWADLAGQRFAVDPLPSTRATTAQLPRAAGDDQPEPAFNIYLLGHDTVGGHRLRFTPGRGGARIDWEARIALTYAGDQRFIHRLTAHIDAARFEGFRAVDGLPPDVASDLLAVFTTDPSVYRRRGTAFVPA